MSVTGFLKYNRQLPSKQSVTERIQHSKEFVDTYTEVQLDEQAGRCMNCGVPFCHSGCPLGNLIPDFNEAVQKKDWYEAYQVLSSTNNFPEFTGRICPAPCEAACVLGINEPAVTIEEIEKHIIEIAFEKGYVRAFKPTLRTGKKIAVIGSGPAGLAAAAQLNYCGHSVTVFERDDVPGGLLRYGIPDFKLEKWVVDRRIQLLEEEGIQFRCNANVGFNVDVNELLREYNAIVLTGGSTVPRDLLIPGRGAKGVHFAMDFLKQNNKRVAAKEYLQFNSWESNSIPFEVNAKDKHVVVIGGGDTGSDCIGTSKRQGALSVTQFELLPQPPAERDDHMPWPSYPMLLKTTSSHEEGAQRKWAVATKEFIHNDKGELTALKIVDLEWKIVDGRPATFVEVAGSENIIPCDLALLAMGFLYPQKEGLLEQLEVELDERKNVRASEKTYQTNLAKVFAAGDMRRGQSLVVWAIYEGRECADKVNDYLGGNSY